MRSRSIAAVALLALALAAGCGGDDGEEAEQPPATTAETNGGEASGEAVFTQNCGSCHVLAAAGTSGTTGPSLDEVMPDEAEVEEQVRNGGGGMPAFEGELATPRSWLSRSTWPRTPAADAAAARQRIAPPASIRYLDVSPEVEHAGRRHHRRKSKFQTLDRCPRT